MSDYTIHLRVEEEYTGRVNEDALRRAATLALATAKAPAPAALSVVIAEEDTLHTLNARHRDTDAPTDVLSFPTGDDPFATEPGEPPYLGDVVVAFPIAESQASAAGHSPQDELHLLTIHGVLHLLGYDHGTPDEQAAMWAAESGALDALREASQ